ncbi:Bicaudal D-related protein 1 [Liparis tanakae]|uniref:Bicaudal D-related protein 1 n=1 Tax=Liparis tanakae TaxID=230148 RepID=A0A4Z2IBY8_9TELE|nr:Bicaudal D-related protein 1 [Liparis tanakae]
MNVFRRNTNLTESRVSEVEMKFAFVVKLRSITHTSCDDALNDDLIELEQGRHALRLKLEGSQAQWESQVSELERDARELSAEVERLSAALGEAERGQSRARLEDAELTQRLREQLDAANVALRHGNHM